MLVAFRSSAPRQDFDDGYGVVLLQRGRPRRSLLYNIIMQIQPGAIIL